MIQTEIQSKRLQLIINAASLLLIVGALLCVYTPDNLMLKGWASYASQITLGYWLLGLLFLSFKLNRLTMVSFVCCAFLCIYLKSTTNPALQSPARTGEPTLKVAQFNLSAYAGDYSTFLTVLRKTKADIISIQEITPDWNRILTDSLNVTYPHQCDYLTMEIYSLKVLSKYSFAVCDTIFCENVPSLILAFKNKANEKPVYIFSTYIGPPLFSSAYLKMQKQLDTIAYQIKKIHAPTITIGDYNIHASSAEIQEFRKLANLNDSRRGYSPAMTDGHISLLDVPTDHIFYNNHFNCIDFQTVSGPQSERLGILGVYQFVKDSLIVNK
jgi:endonuclease/exonuclease/phosphatase (EEP) superfamily protein YafD